MLVFEERLENRRTGEKPLGAKTRTNNKARYLIAFRKRENTFFFPFACEKCSSSSLFNCQSQEKQNKSKKDIYYRGGEKKKKACNFKNRDIDLVVAVDILFTEG